MPDRVCRGVRKAIARVHVNPAPFCVVSSTVAFNDVSVTNKKDSREPSVLAVGVLCFKSSKTNPCEESVDEIWIAEVKPYV